MMKTQNSIRREARRRGRRGARRGRRGVTIIYLLVILTIIFAFASFAVDYGRVQLAKTQLQTATDSAAKWAALRVRSGKTTVLARANEAAADNTVNGVAPSFSAADVQIGTWNSTTRVFTPDATPYNAVKLTGTAVVPLMLGSVVQKPSVTIRVHAIARAASSGGFTGLSGVTFHNNMFLGSYDSGLTTSPTQSTAGVNATISSNGDIVGHMNGTVQGDVVYGPDGSVDVGNWNVSGSTIETATAITPPTMPAWNPSSNPGSISNGDYVHNGGTLNGGTYWFNSLTLKGTLTFNGPATVYVNGDILLDGNNISLSGYQNVPSNLKLYQLGADRSFTCNNDASITAIVLAPGSDLLAKNKLAFYGMAFFESITVKNTATFFFDESGSFEQKAALVQ